jgi:hypothetical protein
MTLGELVSLFLAEQRTECQLLDSERVIAQAVAAMHFYSGYGHLDVTNFVPEEKPIEPPAPIDPLAQFIDYTEKPKRLIDEPTAEPLPPIPFTELAETTVVSPSDWAIIRPLFLLYCEREQALMLEASRVMGVDVFGRASSEVQMDINTAESELPQKAFIQPVFSI